MAKKKVQDSYTKVCMKCQSPDVYVDATNPLIPHFGLPPVYICNSCNFSGTYFPEMKVSDLNKHSDKIKNAIKPHSQVPIPDTIYGKFEVNIIWKFAGPFMTLFSLLAIYKTYNFGLEGIIPSLLLLFMGLGMTYYAYRNLWKSN